MSQTVTLRKLTEGLWRHEPDDKSHFFNGQYYALITEGTFTVYSRTGRLATNCPISGVTVIDGSETFNTSNFSQLAVYLFDKKYPGIYIGIGGGGGSTSNFVVYERTVTGTTVTVESGLSDIVVVNRNNTTEEVVFGYSGSTITIVSGAFDGDKLLIFAKK